MSYDKAADAAAAPLVGHGDAGEFGTLALLIMLCTGEGGHGDDGVCWGGKYEVHVVGRGRGFEVVDGVAHERVEGGAHGGGGEEMLVVKHAGDEEVEDLGLFIGGVGGYD